MTDLLQFTDAIAALFGTYLIHSTICLATCAAAVYIANPKSYATLPIATSLVTSMLSQYSFQFGYVIDDKLLESVAASREVNWTSTNGVLSAR